MSRAGGFFEELKRRKVVRVGIVYLAVVWAAVQVTDVFVPALGLPPVMVTIVAVLAIVGLPVALAMAWAFDVTPEGVRRVSAPDAHGARPGSASNPWLSPVTVVVALALAGVGFAAGSFVGRPDGSAADARSARLAVAVLPFEARGSEDETGFAEGVHDDILTQLSRIEALRITSRTSVQAYRGTTRNIRSIAAELGVGSVLEGGVQRTADRVRINVQLIDGATDEHLWAETYDRALTAENVFAIQSEIARAVADALEATLTADDEAALQEVPTNDLVALDLYHRGRRLYDELGTDARQGATVAFEQAVERDPRFVRAWAELARARSFAIREGRSGDTLPARMAMERTVELAPGTVDAALARSNYLYYARGDYAAALEAVRDVAEQGRADVDLQFTIGNLLRRLNRWAEATALYEDLWRREPRHARMIYDLAWTYAFQRRWHEAESTYRRFQELVPDAAAAHWGRADVALLSRGDTARARQLVESTPRLTAGDADVAAVYLAQLAYMRGERPPRDPLTFSDDAGSFTRYGLYPDGPVELWQARMLWTVGDTMAARALSDGLEAAYVAGTPAVQPGSNVIPEDGDVFGARTGQLLLRAWGLAFRNKAQEARQVADQAIELHSFTDDGSQGVNFVRQRALIRIVTGDHDGAVADLRDLIARPGYTNPWELRLDPIYDPLRERSDFQQLLDDR